MTLMKAWAKAALGAAATAAAVGALAIASPAGAVPSNPPPNPARPLASLNAEACASIFAHNRQAQLATNNMAAPGLANFFAVGTEFCLTPP